MITKQRLPVTIRGLNHLKRLRALSPVTYQVTLRSTLRSNQPANLQVQTEDPLYHLWDMTVSQLDLPCVHLQDHQRVLTASRWVKLWVKMATLLDLLWVQMASQTEDLWVHLWVHLWDQTVNQWVHL